MKALSVVIISYNEANNIGRCIDSVRWVADEIIVLDAYSTDDTVLIATQKGAIVQQDKFSGYIQQKNKALQLAQYNLVLSLDADEALSIDLANAILEAKRHSAFRAYTMNRCTCFCGQFIHHGLWYPDRKLRMFDKRIAHWGGINPHDTIELLTAVPIQKLQGEILHYVFNSISEYLARNEELSSISAKSLFDSGRKVPSYKIVFSPLWAFINGYFLRLGFLEGYFGLLIAIHTANLSYLKYQKLLRLKRQGLKIVNQPIAITQQAEAVI